MIKDDERRTRDSQVLGKAKKEDTYELTSTLAAYERVSAECRQLKAQQMEMSAALSYDDLNKLTILGAVHNLVRRSKRLDRIVFILKNHGTKDPNEVLLSLLKVLNED